MSAYNPYHILILSTRLSATNVITSSNAITTLLRTKGHLNVSFAVTRYLSGYSEVQINRLNKSPEDVYADLRATSPTLMESFEYVKPSPVDNS